MKLTIDFETRSPVDLKACGMYVYARHPRTEIQCLAVKVDDQKPMVWIPPHHTSRIGGINSNDIIDNAGLEYLMDQAGTIHAHNAGFERQIWDNIMSKRYGFKPLPFEKLRCTAAKAAAHALPRDLERAGAALGLTIQKDKVGYSLMLKMCKPRKLVKKEREKIDVYETDKDINKYAYYNGETLQLTYYYHETADDFQRLCLYCCKDVDAEYALCNALLDLSEHELNVWRMDQEINDRGVYIDTDGIKNLIDKMNSREKELILEIQKITKGFVQSATQIDNIIRWMQREGHLISDMQKETVKNYLVIPGLPENVKRVLEIRQSIGKTSTAKLETFIDWRNDDGRVRGMFMYHGASTGRWSSKGPQMQNLPRNSFGPEEVENILSMSKNMIEALYDCPIQIASKCIRGMVMASPGNTLVCADLSAIEARVVAWLAGEQKVLDAFTNKKDLYKVAASDIYGVKYEDVTKEQRSIGKVAVLALGYQGWVSAFNSMAGTYGVYVEEDQAKEIIVNWRKGNPNIVSYWHQLEHAAISAIRTGKAYDVGAVKFGMRGKFLCCRLPNGRVLSYLDPKIIKIQTPYSKEKDGISFQGEDSVTKKFGKQLTYGGKLAENITQAMSRDILVEAMLKLRKAGLPIVFHVHDEAVCEIPEAKATPEFLKAFEQTLAITPSWAKGLPLGAEGWVGKRYRK